MASFVSDVYDKDEDATDCTYTLYHYDTDNKSDDHDTENQQVSIDSEDSDVDGNGVPFAEDDIAIIHLWNDDKEQCAVVKIVSDGSDSYSPDYQILACQEPTCTIDVDDGTVNHDVPAGGTSSDEYQWDFNGTTHYHKASWYGQTLCDNVGIDKTEYDFDDGDGFAEDDVHQYEDIGDYDVTMKVTNKCGLTHEDTKTIRIKYNEPIITLSNDPVKPKVNEDTTVTIDVDDPDDRETDRQYYMDDEETDDTTFNWEELDDHTFKCTIYWNDGFDDQEVSKELLIEMKNEDPTLDMEAVESDDEDGKWTILSGADDPEDNLDRVEYWLYVDRDNILDPNDDDPYWMLIDSGSVKFDLDMEIFQNGDYKVEMIAYDGDGGQSDRESVEFTESDLDGAVAAECEKLDPNEQDEVTTDDPEDNGDGTSTTKNTTADGVVVYVTTDNDTGEVLKVRNESINDIKTEVEDGTVKIIDADDNETSVDVGSTSSETDDDTGDVTVTTTLADGTELEVVYDSLGKIKSGKFTDEDGTVTDMEVGDTLTDSNGNDVELTKLGMNYEVNEVVTEFNEEETVVNSIDAKVIVYPATGESMTEHTDGQRALVQEDGTVVDETYKYTVLLPEFAEEGQLVTIYADGKVIDEYKLTQDDIDAGSADMFPVPQPRLDETVTFRINDSGSGSVEMSGVIRLESGRFEMVDIPVTGVTVSEYFLAKIEDATGKAASETIEFVKAYPSNSVSSGKYLGFVPGVTRETSSYNFKLVEDDNGEMAHVPFFVKTKPFEDEDDVIEISWTTEDNK